MSRIIACSLVALALGVASPGRARQPSAHEELARHLAALHALCPPAKVLTATEADALPIHVTKWGHGPEVLIVHGGVQGRLGGGPLTFAKQAALADEGWQVVLVDRPGFGGSPSRGPDDMQADAPWIADMLGGGANLIGHSWGGAEALLAAARRPQAVRSLVLVEPALDGLVADDPAVRNDPAVREGDRRRYQAWMATRSPAEFGIAFERSLGVGTIPGGKSSGSGPGRTDDAAAADSVGCSFLDARMAPPPILARAADIVAAAGIPVLVISGGWSPVFETNDDAIAKRLHGRHVVVRSPDHYVMFDNPGDFDRVVNKFMRDADRARGAQPAGAP